mmetsp:Transcript_69489/g.195991  ORF Transcript_69489/g.195991 Transcript_69489/m.195991 type:complete len:214 (-) Transcript_69489:6-647(-)
MPPSSWSPWHCSTWATCRSRRRASAASSARWRARPRAPRPGACRRRCATSSEWCLAASPPPRPGAARCASAAASRVRGTCSRARSADRHAIAPVLASTTIGSSTRSCAHRISTWMSHWTTMRIITTGYFRRWTWWRSSRITAAATIACGRGPGRHEERRLRTATGRPRGRTTPTRGASQDSVACPVPGMRAGCFWATEWCFPATGWCLNAPPV